MYLFSRRARLAGGNTRTATTWAVGVTEKVNQITGLGVSLFSQVFSPELGTLVWSSFVPDLKALEAAQDKLLADDGFVAMADEGAAMTIGGVDDAVLQIVHGEVDPNRHVEYVTSVQAVCANGKVGRGVEVGIEIAQRAERITGIPTLFATTMTGTYGGVGWITGHADIGAMERAQATLAADRKFAEFIDREAGSVYAAEPALTRQLVYRRIV